MLRVSELRARKRVLEEEMAKLIQDFEQETGVEIDGLITLERQKQHTVVTGMLSASIKVEVHLDM